MKTKQPECLECEKLSGVADLSQPIGEFLEWLNGQSNVVLAKWVTQRNYFADEENILIPIDESINQLLAEYFDIDLDKVEKERSALLKWIQEQQEMKNG